MKHAIVYYSYEGATALVAEWIAKEVHADLFPLKPIKEPIIRGFGKYVWGGGMVMMKQKPKLEPLGLDCQAVDVIWIGTPVWAWTFTPPIRTFLDECTIKGKKVMLFCTHDGQPGKTLEHMARHLSLSNDLLGATSFQNVKQREDAQREVLEWVRVYF